MTSVVDTSVKFARWDQPGMLTLAAQSGSLIALLDALLVNGWGNKAATSLVVTGGIAQLNIASASVFIRDNVIVVSGAINGALNGEQKVTEVSSTYVRFATAAANGTDGGTVTFKGAPLGFTKVFTGTNKAVYKSGDVTANNFVLRVDDSATTYAKLTGYETMTDIDTGGYRFPTNVQAPIDGYWWKGRTASATAVPWIFAGDSKMWYLSIAFGVPNTAQAWGAPLRGWGDPIAFRPGGDPYLTLLTVATDTALNSDSSGQSYWGSFDYNSSQPAYAPRGFSGLGSAIQVYSRPYIGLDGGWSGVDSTMGSFPSGISGALILSKRYLSQSGNNTPRGELPGLFTSPQTVVLDGYAYGSYVEGTGILAGRRLVSYVTNSTTFVYNAQDRSTFGAAFLDITGPWR